jgi:hypothetical protein
MLIVLFSKIPEESGRRGRGPQGKLQSTGETRQTRGITYAPPGSGQHFGDFRQARNHGPEGW